MLRSAARNSLILVSRPRARASSATHATTSTRLHVETIAASCTPSRPARRASAGCKSTCGNARRSRTAIGAVRWLKPTMRMSRAMSVEAAAVLTGEEDVAEDERDQHHREADDRDRREPPTAPPGDEPRLQQPGVEHPHDQREHLARLPRPEAAPRVLAPDGAGDDAEREEREAPGERAVVQLVEGLE